MYKKVVLVIAGIIVFGLFDYSVYHYSVTNQTVSYEWEIPAQESGAHQSGWARIKVTSPNDTLGNQTEFTLACL